MYHHKNIQWFYENYWEPHFLDLKTSDFNDEISNAVYLFINKNYDEDNLNLYWGNIKNEYGVNYTKGGRVCSVVANNSYSLFNALSTIYNNINYLMYREQYYRTDIGLKYLLNN